MRYFFMATKAGKCPLFFEVTECWHPQLIDGLHDSGYKLCQVTDWYYKCQLVTAHPSRIHNGLVYELDEGDKEFKIPTL